MFVAGRVEVEIVVADDIPPRHSNQGHDAVVCFEEGEVVEQDVAERDTEPGLGADQLLDGVARHVTELLPIARLGVAEEMGLEPVGLLLAAEREVDGGGKGAGRFDAGEL